MTLGLSGHAVPHWYYKAYSSTRGSLATRRAMYSSYSKTLFGKIIVSSDGELLVKAVAFMPTKASPLRLGVTLVW